MNKDIIIGTAQMYREYGIANKNIINDQEINSIFSQIKRYSFKYIDTANSYQNDKLVSNHYKNDDNLNYIYKIDKNTDKQIDQIINEALTMYGSYPNTVLAHSIKIYTDSKFTEICLKLKKEKKIKKFGISVYDKNEIQMAISYHKPDIIQLPLNIVDKRLLENGSINFLKELSIEIHVRSIFLQGLLYLPLELAKLKFPNIEKIFIKLLHIAESYGMSLAQLSLFWIYFNSNIDSIVIGVNSKNQLIEQYEFLNKSIDKKKLFQKIHNDIMSISFNDINVLDPRRW